MGIDPGYGRIGWGVVDKGRDLKLVEYGVIQTPPSEATPVRLCMIFEQLAALISRHNPDAIAVEDLFFNTNITTGIKVAQARGVILLCASHHCGDIYEYTPLQVKSALTGNGTAEKKQVEYMVKAILNIKEKISPDDAADALAIAICHINTNLNMKGER